MTKQIKNVVVVGGSYVGLGAARNLMDAIPCEYRVLLIEPHTHFHHLFTFPRIAVAPGFAEKAFIPYSGVFGSARHRHLVARAVNVGLDYVEIDQSWEGSCRVSFEYLILATGTQLSAPSMAPFDDKAPSVSYFKDFQVSIKRANSIAIVGGGAVGVQMALDIKELSPEKKVTVVHSRAQLMPQFHFGLHDIVKQAFTEYGVDFIPKCRVRVPPGGFPASESPIDIELNNGQRLTVDRVVLATGQKPNNRLLATLSSFLDADLINPRNGFIRMRPTLQLDHPQCSKIFALGDIADTGSHKAARPGAAQAVVLAKNVQAMIQGQAPVTEIEVAPPAIHLTLGITRSVLFRNPNPAKGIMEPMVTDKLDGEVDMRIESMWSRLQMSIQNASDYHL